MPQTISRNPIRAILRAAVAVTALAPMPAAASDVATLIDLAAERRFVVSLGHRADSLRATADGPLGRPVTMRMPRAALMHRFTGRLVDAEGRPIAGPVAWSVTLGEGSLAAVAVLSSARADVGIPRPYGVRFEAGDLLVVTAEVASDIEGASLVVSMEYELPDQSTTRLAARAIVVHGGVREADEQVAAALEWTWTANAADRLVAITADGMAGAAEVVVEDATTGAAIWRMRGPSRFANSAAQLGETVYPGVRLETGRSYRLRVVRSASAADAARTERDAAVAPTIDGLPLLLLVPDAPRR